jgi:hypothetical protein
MRNKTEHTESGKQYAVAYATQYTTKDLHEALNLYRNIISLGDTVDLELICPACRSQIQNIVNAVVPKQELFDTQVDLALAQFEHTQKRDN